MTLRIFSVFLLVMGEALCVYAEMVAAQSHAADPSQAIYVFTRNFLCITLAGALLIAGYMIGYTSFKNIWIVSVVSVTSILIVEPGLTYAIFSEMPGRGAAVGLVFGALGFLATLFL